MRSKTEGLSAARSKDNQALGFSGDELLSFLAAQAHRERIKPDDVTIRKLAAKLKESGSPGSEARAKRILNVEVEAGRLIRVQCVNDNGRIEYAYRPKP